MIFQSILFDGSSYGEKADLQEVPVYFADLNLDQVIDSITAGKKEYNLKPYFYTPLRDMDLIHYRHEIMRDLEYKNLMENIKSFASKMIIVRRYLAMIEKLYYKYHQEGWLLKAADVYCEAVSDLVRDLNQANIMSSGLVAFREFAINYADSDEFTLLLRETKELKNALATVKYAVIIKDSTIRVRKYEDELNYSIEVEKTFEKFKQGAVKDYRLQLNYSPGMNHVEAQILEFVARLYPQIFADLDSYCERHNRFLNETIRVFDHEIQFYIAYLDFLAKFKQAGLQVCYPVVSLKDKGIYDYEGYDIALANKRISEKSQIVCNDFYLKGKERIIIVSGPNQGGKTTFARTFGQLHYLASLGCPVPGKEARLFLFDQIHTHFEKEEDIKNLCGKLQDDLVRIYDILDRATPESILIMNEIFTSTTEQDAVFLSKKIMDRIFQLDLLCVWVTFVDELASSNEKTVSMVSTVVPENPAERTYKIVRLAADGLAYALSIAEKYQLTYDSLKERLRS